MLEQVGWLVGFAVFMIAAITSFFLSIQFAADIVCRAYFRHKLEYTRRLIGAKHGGNR